MYPGLQTQEPASQWPFEPQETPRQGSAVVVVVWQQVMPPLPSGQQYPSLISPPGKSHCVLMGRLESWHSPLDEQV